MNWKEIIGPLLAEFYERPILASEHIYRNVRVPDIKGKINTLIGMRRTGKTTLLFQQIDQLKKQSVDPQAIFYMNFEDDRLPPLVEKSLTHIVDSFYQLYPQNHSRECHLFFDEVQNVENWSPVLRRLIDTRRVKITVTGSSAKLLSKEISTSLRGRAIATEVWPYSFYEYLKAQSTQKSLNGNAPTLLDSLSSGNQLSPRLKDEMHQNLIHFLKTGGFPEVVCLEELDRRRIHQDYISIVILRDIIERHNIKNESLLKYFTKVLVTQIARPMSLNKLYNELKSHGREVARNTLYQYLDFLSDCFLAFSIPLFSQSLRKQQSNPRKIYSIDSGISHSYSLDVAENLGRLFENLIYIDLRRRGDEVWYYRTHSGREVDFVSKGLNGSFQLIQVCLDLSDDETRQREEIALHEAEKELGIKGIIVTPENYLEFVTQGDSLR